MLLLKMELRPHGEFTFKKTYLFWFYNHLLQSCVLLILTFFKYVLRSRISEASDAFSFGKVVLEMITGAISTIDNPFSDMFEDEESESEYPIDVAFDRVSFFFHFLPLLPVLS